jgi:hypothetical protein
MRPRPRLLLPVLLLGLLAALPSACGPVQPRPEGSPTCVRLGRNLLPVCS